jgi:hypothetical protein
VRSYSFVTVYSFQLFTFTPLHTKHANGARSAGGAGRKAESGKREAGRLLYFPLMRVRARIRNRVDRALFTYLSRRALIALDAESGRPPAEYPLILDLWSTGLRINLDAARRLGARRLADELRRQLPRH